MQHRLRQITDLVKNCLLVKTVMAYIVEPESWSVNWVGKQIVAQLHRRKMLCADVRTTSMGLRHTIVHFGSIHTALQRGKLVPLHSSNKIVLTWFHLLPKDERLALLPELVQRVDMFHTTAQLTRELLIKGGVPAARIQVIPLGIDLQRFRRYDPICRQRIRKKIGIPDDAFVVGSFQKDGVGWGVGREPKTVKGPDVFCDVVGQLVREREIFVLLTGPARGYVTERLRRMHVPFRHDFLKQYYDIADYYNSLDLYLVTSRAEGGPQAILESWATGVPVVTTAVGMAKDIVRDGVNGAVADVDDVAALTRKASAILENPETRARLITNGLQDVSRYDYALIAERYFTELYQPLL